MLTIARLEELERAAANALDETRAGHRDTVLQIRADELAELCRAARYGHDCLGGRDDRDVAFHRRQ